MTQFGPMQCDKVRAILRQPIIRSYEYKDEEYSVQKTITQNMNSLKAASQSLLWPFSHCHS